MKIAILTRRAGYNMGSSLQAYAMSKIFSKLGHEVEVLNYDEYANYLLWRIKPFVNNVLFATFKALPFLQNLYKNKVTSLDRAFIQQQKFKQFEASFMPLSSKQFKSSKDLSCTNGSYEAYICGSDQIWSPQMFDPAYFLDFVDKAKSKTIAYAPSIAVTEAERISDEAKKLIRNIDHISCREKEGSKVLSEITGTNVVTVLDPTLMLDKEDWLQITPKRPIIDGDYILTYFLHTQFFENNIPNDFIKQLKEKTGLSVINIQMYNMQQVVEADKHLYDCGPVDFLNLIKNATYVVTNSFHCCVFSFIFERKFFVSKRFRKRDVTNNQNPRIYTLLDTINMPESLIVDEEWNMDRINDMQERDLSLFKQKRNESFNFIQSALGYK